MIVTVLFARRDSNYKCLPMVDVWDEDRDARNWPGGNSLIAHPPCRLWGRLRQFAKSRDPEAERALAVMAVWHIRTFGGVLEHPEHSTLWAHCGMPRPGRGVDEYGGWTLQVDQCDFGHRAEKSTWLYIVGTPEGCAPARPPRGTPTGVIRTSRPRRPDSLPIVTKAEREHTPPPFAVWLVELCRWCQLLHKN